MATVWLVSEDDQTRPSGPLRELPVGNFEALLGLRESDFVAELGMPPPSLGPGDPGGGIGAFRHVIVEVDADEAAGHGWRPGFYKAPLTPREALDVLGLGATEFIP
jgi:hypothetical protein